MATSTSDTAFLTVEKSFPYRGVREHWVNVYHLDQQPPTTLDWSNLASLVRGLEAPCFPSSVQFERYTGHAPGTPPLLVYEEDVPPPGEGGTTGSFTPLATEHEAPGDSAIWVRYGTTQKNKLGKPIYLRNYYHAVFYDTTVDTLSARQKTEFDALGTAFVNGINWNGITYHRAGPRGAVAQNRASSQWITTHTLKARGRRRRITQAQLKAAFDAGKANDVPFILGPAIG